MSVSRLPNKTPVSSVKSKILSDDETFSWVLESLAVPEVYDNEDLVGLLRRFVAYNKPEDSEALRDYLVEKIDRFAGRVSRISALDN